MANVLLLNGSPHAHGAIDLALTEVAQTLQECGLTTEIVHIGQQDIRGCIACGRCGVLHHCAFDDAVNALAPKFEAADALIVGSPVYYASANGTLTNLLDRLFYSTPFDKTMKVGAAVVSCRRGGASATFDQLNKYFTIPGCQLHRASTGTASTATMRRKPRRMRRGCKSCGRLGGTWRFW